MSVPGSNGSDCENARFDKKGIYWVPAALTGGGVMTQAMVAQLNK